MPRKKTSVEIVDHPDDAEYADVVVCTPLTDPLALPDNLVATCSRCFQLIQHRPDAPVTPPKMCIACAMPRIEKEAGDGSLEVLVTREGARLWDALLQKKRAN